MEKLTVVCHGIQARTTAPTISLFWRNVLRPVSTEARVALWYNVTLWSFGSDKVLQAQAHIPCNEHNSVSNFEEDRHSRHWRGSGKQGSEEQRGEDSGQDSSKFFFVVYLYLTIHLETDSAPVLLRP